MKNNNDIENQKHIEKIYANKATNLLKICIILSIVSGLTYLIGILSYNSFDFGLILEIVSFIFIIFAISKINQNNLQSGKRNTIIAMIPLLLLVIYDLLHLLSNINEVTVNVIEYYTSFDQFFYYLEPYLFDVTSVASIFLLFKAYFSLSKADGSTKINNYVDNFYDSL